MTVTNTNRYYAWKEGETAAIIGMWRQGASDEQIADIMKCHEGIIRQVILFYKTTDEYKETILPVETK